MDILYVSDPVRFARMTTDEIRQSFLLDRLFSPDTLSLWYLDVDRAIVGSAVPIKKPLKLSGSKEIASNYFAERREIGILNVGGKGQVVVDQKSYDLNNLDGLYIGRGSRDITFESEKDADPAQFYILSYPAHNIFPTVPAKKNDAEQVQLGSIEKSNKRTIFKLIHPNGVKSCQLVMGYTVLEPGCVWNTMPPHTHERRMEVYFYFNVDASDRVFHLMGPPEATCHIVIADKQAVVSPSWSIHSGVGTGAYTFCWGMGGENQEFDDMDGIDIGDLK
jgi:4-deoxy-L-threo-5-hexosulose-uronate ketol-isomerase